MYTHLDTFLYTYVAETGNQETRAPHKESWRTPVHYAIGPRGVNTPSSEPQAKGLQSFYLQTGMIKWVCGFSEARTIAKNKTRVSEKSSSS